MNAFRILDEKGSPITMGYLDKVAATFWNKEIHHKRYAAPYKAKDDSVSERMKETISTNWFDMIGKAIAEQGCHTKHNSWDNVVITMTAEDIGEAIVSQSYLRDEMSDETLIVCVKNVMYYHKPYVELIREFERRGWTPEQVIQE